MTPPNINPRQPKWPWWRLAMAGLSLLALCLCAGLSWRSLTDGVIAGCGGGSSCEKVLSSRWATVAKIVPVSGLALGAYLTTFVAVFSIGSGDRAVRRLAWGVMLVIAGSILGGAVWFTVVQKWILGEFCIYCMTTHLTGSLLAVLVIRRALKEKGGSPATERRNVQPLTPTQRKTCPSTAASLLIRPAHSVRLVTLGAATAAALAILQITQGPVPSQEGRAAGTSATELSSREMPMIGSPSAPTIISVLFDFKCSHCQKLHFLLVEAARQYRGRVAFALYPTPLEPACNPFVPAGRDEFAGSCALARTGLALWLSNHEAYEDFAVWMFTFDSGNRWQPRTLEAATERAVALVGKDAFAATMANPRVDRYLQAGTQLFGQTIQEGKGGIPKLIYDGRWIIPEALNAKELMTILHERLGIPLP